ncbi:MAG: sugar phosphate isomerase/epimerase [Vicinamibacterales bacterium]
MDVARRSVLKGLAAGVTSVTGVASANETAADSAQTPAGPGPAWGVQLYTVRDQLAADARATLARVAAIGFKELEVLQPTLAVVTPLARELGLSIVSVHLDASTSEGDGFDRAISTLRDYGVRDVVVPFVPAGGRPTTRKGFEALGARLARMARTASTAGLRFGYHNHAFEFGRDADGSRWIETLMQSTADAGVFLQLDVFWASVAGGDPVALLGQYKGRIGSLHLKDKDRSVATTLAEDQVPRTGFTEVGSGSLDFPSILAAARAAGIRHYFVEQDFASGNPLDSLAKSHSYLSGLAVR